MKPQWFWALLGQVGLPTFWGCNFFIRSPFGYHNTSFRRSLREGKTKIHKMDLGTFLISSFSHKMSFWASKLPQNFRTRKLPKIESFARIKEIERKQCWGSKWNRQVTTNIQMDQGYGYGLVIEIREKERES